MNSESKTHTDNDGGRTRIGNTPSTGLPPDPEGMNDERAEWALSTIQAFGTTTGECFYDFDGQERDAILQQNISDLLGDLAHLCDREGVNLRAMLDRAEHHYNEETDNEGEQFSFLDEPTPREDSHPQTDEHLAGCTSCMMAHDKAAQ
jgi:hypothetical protein